jgi:nitroreductase
MSDILPSSPDELLTTTRSVRRRLDLERPVPVDIVREALEVALQAPTGSNAQTWHWIVVTDREKRQAIARMYARSFARYRASSTRTYADPTRQAVQQRVSASADYLAEHMGDVPVLVIGAIFTGAEEFEPGSQAGLWGSLLPAAWSLQLALRARGLGSAWTTLHLAYEREIAELLGIPPTVHQGVLVPVAYTVGTDFRPAHRAPLDDVLHINGW